MRRDQLPPHSRHTFVLPQHKVVYVSTPKVACTSLKFVVAELGGETIDEFYRAARPGTMSAIHNRGLWQKVPTLHDLSDEQLANVDGENGWHVFAVVRHPAARLWSAWQQKLLFRVPRMLQKIPDHVVPPVPHTTIDVVEAFGGFVSAAARGECPQLMRDPHFDAQRHVLAARRMPYTRVYDITEIGQLTADLDAHVRAHGGGPVPALRSNNETVLRPLRPMFTDEVQTGIERLYAADFRRWYRGADPVPAGVTDDDDYPDEQLAEVRQLIEYGRR